jgi:archaellum component FlaC
MDEKILEMLCLIDKKIDKIQTDLIEIKDNSKKMNDHIDFIEQTYDSLKTPIEFIKNKFNYLQLNSKKE